MGGTNASEAAPGISDSPTASHEGENKSLSCIFSIHLHFPFNIIAAIERNGVDNREQGNSNREAGNNRTHPQQQDGATYHYNRNQPKERRRKKKLRGHAENDIPRCQELAPAASGADCRQFCTEREGKVRAEAEV